MIDLSHAVTEPLDVGTRLVAPFHGDPRRADLAGMPLQRLVNVSILVVKAYAVAEVAPEHFGDPGLLWGRAVLVYTGWASRWRTAAYREPDRPDLSAAAVDLLVAANVAIVGMDAGVVDFGAPDQPASGARCRGPVDRLAAADPESRNGRSESGGGPAELKPTPLALMSLAASRRVIAAGDRPRRSWPIRASAPVGGPPARRGSGGELTSSGIADHPVSAGRVGDCSDTPR